VTIRTLLTDVMWNRLLPLLPPQKLCTGRHSIDHRRFIEAVLWLARTGLPWRNLPAELMNWRTAWRRLQRWTKAGIWSRILADLRAVMADAGWQVHMLDSTIIRGHACAAGARKSAGGQALGRSCGGFSMKLHLRADAHGRPVALQLTGGERHDLLDDEPLFEQVALRTARRGWPRWKPAAILADKSYSVAWLLDALRRKRIVLIIPNRRYVATTCAGAASAASSRSPGASTPAR